MSEEVKEVEQTEVKAEPKVVTDKKKFFKHSKNKKKRGVRNGAIHFGAGSGNYQFPCHPL